MQERRTTIRIARAARTQYCPSGDLIPRDGRITNLSERGVHLLAQESHRVGERVTLSFSFPGEEEPLTATGVVRWTDPQARRGRHAMGLEWLPLGETSRHRLGTFLGRTEQAASGQAVAASPRSWTMARTLVFRTGVVFAILAGIAVAQWAFTIQRDNQQFGVALQQRNAIIHALEEREVSLQQEMAATQAQLAATFDEVTRLAYETTGLQEEAKDFHHDVQRLNQEVERFQASYVRAQEERERLVQRVLDLEQERTQLAREREALARKLASIPELRKAIREAIIVRRHAQHLVRQASRQSPDTLASVEGNRGYLIWDGQSTWGDVPVGSTMTIHVHEPEALSPVPTPALVTPTANE
jgi:uncharacterized protein (TIGR02266 family)